VPSARLHVQDCRTLPTYEMVCKDLNLNTCHGHPEVQPQAAPVQARGGAAGGLKPDELPRPQIGEGASQTGCTFILGGKDTRSRQLDGQQAIDQFWTCASDEPAKFIEAKETGKRSTTQIAAEVGLNKLSDYQMCDRAHTLPKAEADLVPEGKCGFCNNTGHARRLSSETREAKCRA
jgi:hypothetical protein